MRSLVRQAVQPSRDLAEAADFFSRSGCLLCDEVVNDGALSMRLGLYPRPSSRILLETDDFLLIPDISPVVPGHSLLLTKTHLGCFADLPRAKQPRLQTTLEQVVTLVRDSYSEPLLFEHGSATPGSRSGACVTHAHIHLIPSHTPVREAMSSFGKVVAVEAALPSSELGCGSGRDYLWYRDPGGQGYVLSTLYKPVPCQFIRRVVARHRGIDNWHWESILKSAYNAP